MPNSTGPRAGGRRPAKQPRLCSLDGCTDRHMARGWCASHYFKWRSAQDVQPTEQFWERFWAKVEIGHPLGCWWWTGRKNKKGYAQVTFRGRGQGAYRWSYQYFHGPIGNDPETGDTLEIDHLCKNPACVNPDHLEPVTRAENIWRSSRYAGHEACPSGHPRVIYGAFNINGHQFCRECSRLRQAKMRESRRAQAA